jgi:hypothetical protein
LAYRGSPEEWDWDGSFGSETNPKPGGEQSKWIKENAQSGGGRNEEYYGKIEDDNRYGNIDCELLVRGYKIRFLSKSEQIQRKLQYFFEWNNAKLTKIIFTK